VEAAEQACGRLPIALAISRSTLDEREQRDGPSVVHEERRAILRRERDDDFRNTLRERHDKSVLPRQPRRVGVASLDPDHIRARDVTDEEKIVLVTAFEPLHQAGELEPVASGDRFQESSGGR
jgi:hypothetical protein